MKQHNLLVSGRVAEGLNGLELDYRIKAGEFILVANVELKSLSEFVEEIKDGIAELKANPQKRSRQKFYEKDEEEDIETGEIMEGKLGVQIGSFEMFVLKSPNISPETIFSYYNPAVAEGLIYFAGYRVAIRQKGIEWECYFTNDISATSRLLAEGAIRYILLNKGMIDREKGINDDTYKLAVRLFRIRDAVWDWLIEFTEENPSGTFRSFGGYYKQSSEFKGITEEKVLYFSPNTEIIQKLAEQLEEETGLKLTPSEYKNYFNEFVDTVNELSRKMITIFIEKIENAIVKMMKSNFETNT